MKVEIRPIEQKKWHGKKGVENFTRPKKISALVDPNTMKYSTGLTPEEEEKYGKLLNQDLSGIFDPTKPSEFWDSNISAVKLENSTTFLNVDIPINYIKYKIIKASKYVANSMKEYEEGLYPFATHVIFNLEEEADLKASRISLKNTAIMESMKLSTDRKIQILFILEGKNYKKQSENYVNVAIDNLVQNKAEDILRLINNEEVEILASHALVLECLQKHILVKKGHKIYYFDSHLGDDARDVALYLNNSENQELKIRLLQAIK